MHDLLVNLGKRSPLPADLRDAVQNYSRWRNTFSACLGVVLLVVVLKYPVARAEFVNAFARRREEATQAQRVFVALQDMLKALAAKAAQRFRDEYDDIKGSLIALGPVIVAEGLHVLELQKNPTKKGLKIGMGQQTYKLLPWSSQAKTAILSFFKMNDFMFALRAPSSVSSWTESYDDFVEAVKAHSVVRMATPGYSQDWTFRTVGIAEMRAANISRLHYSATDLILELPKPDEGGHLKTLVTLVAGEGTVAELYTKFTVKCAPELVAMQCCLALGEGFQVHIGSRAASAELPDPCAQCKAIKKSSYYCRVKKGHKAPAVKRKRAAKRPASARVTKRPASARAIKRPASAV